MTDAPLQPQVTLAHDHEDNAAAWPSQPPHDSIALGSPAIAAQQKPVLHVSRTEDGTWLFSSEATLGDGELTEVCPKCLAKRDPSLLEVADLPVGWKAWRHDAQEPWCRSSSKHIEYWSSASDPGGVSLSLKRFYRHFPEMKPGLMILLFLGRRQHREFIEHVEEHLQLGDSRAAVVVSSRPFLVAAYTDELDCVVLLRFPRKLLKQHQLTVGSRLLTINTYMEEGPRAPDIHPGPESLDNYANYYPIIAEFVSEDEERIETRKQQISEDEWERCLSMGNKKLAGFGLYRDGAPQASHVPAGA